MEGRWRTFRRFVVDTLAWRGRTSRTGFYCSFGLVYLVGLLSVPLTIAETLMFRSSDLGWANPLHWITVALGLAVAAFFLGAFVRRLHDRNKPSWWLLVFFGPHVACVLAVSQIPEADQRALMLGLIRGMFVAAPFLVWGLVEISLLSGTPGPNRFGPNPRPLTVAQPT